jgi:hypothetical protein
MTQVSIDGRAQCFLSGRAFSHSSDPGSEADIVASCVGIFVKQLHPDPVSAHLLSALKDFGRPSEANFKITRPEPISIGSPAWVAVTAFNATAAISASVLSIALWLMVEATS